MGKFYISHIYNDENEIMHKTHVNNVVNQVVG